MPTPAPHCSKAERSNSGCTVQSFCSNEFHAERIFESSFSNRKVCVSDTNETPDHCIIWIIVNYICREDVDWIMFVCYLFCD